MADFDRLLSLVLRAHCLLLVKVINEQDEFLSNVYDTHCSTT